MASDKRVRKGRIGSRRARSDGGINTHIIIGAGSQPTLPGPLPAEHRALTIRRLLRPRAFTERPYPACVAAIVRRRGIIGPASILWRRVFAETLEFLAATPKDRSRRGAAGGLELGFDRFDILFPLAPGVMSRGK